MAILLNNAFRFFVHRVKLFQFILYGKARFGRMKPHPMGVECIVEVIC